MNKQVVPEKRSLIIQAAIRLFAENGFDSTSMTQIAKAAGVAQGTPYLYFRSKDDLIDQVFFHCNALNVAACSEGLHEEPTCIHKLCRRMENAIRWAMEHRQEALVDRMYHTLPNRNIGIRYVEQKTHYELVDKIVLQGLADGELKPLPSPLLGEMFYGLAGAFYHYVREHPDMLDDEQTWKIMKQSVRDSLAR